MAGKTVRTAVAGPVNLLHKQKSIIGKTKSTIFENKLYKF